MIIKDFVYDGRYLSDTGLVVAYLETTPSHSIQMGSQLTFDSYLNELTWKSQYLRGRYETKIFTSFDVIKLSCADNENDYLTDLEISNVMKWLNKTEVKKFVPIYDDASYDGVWYKGTFTEINMIHYNSKCVGFTLTFEADSPWGYSQEYNIKKAVNNGECVCLHNNSDNVGYIYPNHFTITLPPMQSGEHVDVEIENNLDPHRTIIIRNCTSEEVISINSELQIITSSKYKPTGSDINLTHVNFYNDFNYNFPRLVSTNSDSKNILTITGVDGIVIDIRWNEIRKVGIIV